MKWIRTRFISGFGAIGGYGPKTGKKRVRTPFAVRKRRVNASSFRTLGERCLQGNLWYSPPASMTSRLASVTFKRASKVFIEETDKNFDFITETPFRFLGFGDFKVSIVIEN